MLDVSGRVLILMCVSDWLSASFLYEEYVRQLGRFCSWHTYIHTFSQTATVGTQHHTTGSGGSVPACLWGIGQRTTTDATPRSKTTIMNDDDGDSYYRDSGDLIGIREIDCPARPRLPASLLAYSLARTASVS